MRASWVCSLPTSCVVAQGFKPTSTMPQNARPGRGSYARTDAALEGRILGLLQRVAAALVTHLAILGRLWARRHFLERRHYREAPRSLHSNFQKSAHGEHLTGIEAGLSSPPPASAYIHHTESAIVFPQHSLRSPSFAYRAKSSAASAKARIIKVW